MDYPFQKGRRLFVPLNTKYTFNVIPDMILTNDKVKKYPLKARNCFVDETEWDHLKIFKVKYQASFDLQYFLILF